MDISKFNRCERHGYHTGRECPKCITSAPLKCPPIAQNVPLNAPEATKAPDAAETTPNHENNDPPQSPKPERPFLSQSVGQEKGKAGDTKSVHVRVTSYRRRTIDPDNLCPKYFIDCLRYAEIIKDDTAAHITLTVGQEKVASKSDERTEIEII